MIYVALGVIGFAIIHLFDLAALKKVPRAKPVIWAAGSALLIYSLVMLALLPDKLAIPGWLYWVGWGVLGVSGGLFLYSLFVNLPFRKTYVATGVGDRLVRTGMYALVRHPGVIWFTLFMLSLIPVSGSRLMLIAAPVFIALDIALVWIQDRFVFGRMFPDYERYQRETPMLVPNRKSLGAFWRSLHVTKNLAQGG